MDKNHNERKAGRPRLEDSLLRQYWREAKKRQKNMKPMLILLALIIGVTVLNLIFHPKPFFSMLQDLFNYVLTVI